MEKHLYCPHCGRVLLFDDELCPYCGQSISGGRRKYVRAENQAEAQSAAHRRTRTLKFQRTTFIPRQSHGVWTGPDQKRHTGRGRRKSGGSLMIPILTILMLIAAHLKTHDMLDFDFRKTPEPVAEPQIMEIVPTSEVTETTEQPETQETAFPVYGPEDYYFTSEEELDALEPGALWKNPEAFQKLFPGLTADQYDVMELIALDLQNNLSREAILEQLEIQGHSRTETEEVMRRLNINWKIVALRRMLTYFSYNAYSPRGMREEMQYDRFTEAEIQYAFDHSGVDWYHQLELRVSGTLQRGAWSKKTLQNQAILWEFSREDVDRYFESCTIDFSTQAVRALEAYNNTMEVSYEVAAEMLEAMGFTAEEANYAADLVESRKKSE